MSNIEQYQQADGIYYLHPENLLTEESAKQVIEALKSIYQGTEPIYIILDLKNNFVLPIRTLASDIRSFYQNILPGNAPIFIAMLVEPSMIQIIDNVLKTLMRREAIQPFAEIERAKQWLTLERLKQQKKENIGSIMRNDAQE